MDSNFSGYRTFAAFLLITFTSNICCTGVMIPKTQFQWMNPKVIGSYTFNQTTVFRIVEICKKFRLCLSKTNLKRNFREYDQYDYLTFHYLKLEMYRQLNDFPSIFVQKEGVLKVEINALNIFITLIFHIKKGLYNVIYFKNNNFPYFFKILNCCR